MEEEETGEESLNYTEDSSAVMLDFTQESSMIMLDFEDEEHPLCSTPLKEQDR